MSLIFPQIDVPHQGPDHPSIISNKKLIVSARGGGIKIMISLLCKWQLKDTKCCRRCPCISRLDLKETHPAAESLWPLTLICQKEGVKKKYLALCIKSVSLTGSIHCPLICKRPNFWAQSTYPEQNTDKWWKWSTECCGVLLETSIISFTQRALSGVSWLCWRGQRGRRVRKRRGMDAEVV